MNAVRSHRGTMPTIRASGSSHNSAELSRPERMSHPCRVSS